MMMDEEVHNAVRYGTAHYTANHRVTEQQQQGAQRMNRYGGLQERSTVILIHLLLL